MSKKQNITLGDPVLDRFDQPISWLQLRQSGDHNRAAQEALKLRLSQRLNLSPCEAFSEADRIFDAYRTGYNSETRMIQVIRKHSCQQGRVFPNLKAMVAYLVTALHNEARREVKRSHRGPFVELRKDPSESMLDAILAERTDWTRANLSEHELLNLSAELKVAGEEAIADFSKCVKRKAHLRAGTLHYKLYLAPKISGEGEPKLVRQQWIANECRIHQTQVSRLQKKFNEIFQNKCREIFKNYELMQG